MATGDQVLGRAIELARHAHAGQRYPSLEQEPYIEHPLRVMTAVDGTAAKAAAVLHDILEDTDAKVEDLHAAGIPDEVVVAVGALTHMDGQSYEAYIEQVAGNSLARRVKLADLEDNLRNNRRLQPTPDVLARIRRYEAAISRLHG